MEYQVRNLTALGLLVLVAGALFVWGLFYLMGDPLLVGGDEVVVVTRDGGGVDRGAPVQLNGVKVGTVRGVELNAPDRVTMRIKVDDDVRLPADTRAVIRADMFSTTTLDLVPGRALVALEGGSHSSAQHDPFVHLRSLEWLSQKMAQTKKGIQRRLLRR